MHAKIDYIVKAFQAGATGYLAKGSAAEKLLQGMEHVLKGDYFMDTSVSQQVVKKLVGLAPKETLILTLAKVLIAADDRFQLRYTDRQRAGGHGSSGRGVEREPGRRKALHQPQNG